MLHCELPHLIIGQDIFSLTDIFSLPGSKVTMGGNVGGKGNTGSFRRCKDMRSSFGQRESGPRMEENG